ncbi:hypothetical protein F441_00672 [Phytophthora nicotianae CJ01A1]|uniref:GOLD domain-containing protein n=1 Tax=Phytophthora nicotianae CJ01A1 TaxID=1317063 RepID=W2XW53_PHYNI|nr:hypothetical protein F441_00672 [Phytophthora nicotianae CJ01A1]
MAADVSARVHLVAEKLQQKAQDAQRKGNESAARALASSVSDLRQAMALIAEQRHLLARRRGEGDDEEDDADAHVQELVTRLARVEAMLGKKSDDMKAKGNENAAAALQQSASTVEQGRKRLMEQQQTIFGLLGRWERLEGVLDGKKNDREDDTELETPHGRHIARIRRLVQLEAVVMEICPGYTEDEVRKELERLKQGDKELETAREDAVEAQEMLKQESLALEELKQEMERMKEKERLRQEEDAMLLEQQREACQAMEQLVRESDQEIQRMTQSAAIQAEDMQALRVEIESMASEKERLVRAHAAEVEELQGQLESAIDSLSTKADESERSGAEELEELRTQVESLASEKEELEELRTQVESLASEKEELVRKHEDEVEELRLKLENAMASVAAKDENTDSNGEELQAKIDALTSEKEDLVKLHVDEVDELKRTHSLEVEGLHQRLTSAENELSTKTKEESAANDEELVLLQAKVDSLTSEREALAKSHSDEVEELRKAYTDEIEELRSQIESATASSANNDESDASNVEELQSLRDEVKHLISEKDQLTEVHASELEEIREAHLAEIVELRNQLENTAADLSANTASSDELQQLRAEVGALTIEKDHLVREHAENIEKLNHQQETAKSDAESVLGDQVESDVDEDGNVGDNGENTDVPVLELEDELHPVDTAEDQAEASSNGHDGPSDLNKVSEMQAALDELYSRIAEYEERDQAQQDTIKELEWEQTEYEEQIAQLRKDKGQAVDELQRTREQETQSLQTDLDTLQAQLIEYEERCEAQLNTIASLENEQAELQERIERHTREKEQVMNELQNTHGEETTRLAQRVADSESRIEALSAKVEELNKALAAKTTEQSETADSLDRCEADLRAARSELDDRIRECAQLKNDLEALQNAQGVKSGEVEEHLTLLTTELREVMSILSSRDDIDAGGFVDKVWQSQETTYLCSELAPLLTDLVSAQDQLRVTKEQLKLIRSECDKQKLVVNEFVTTSDWRLFAKEGEEDVVEKLTSSEDVDELLAVAKANTVRWLNDLEQLRDRTEKDSVKINELEHEKLQAQECLVTAEDSMRDLEALVESLREQLTALRAEKEEMVKAAEELKTQSHSASLQEQQQQAAQQEEVTELQNQLASVRNDFERYRVRSHTALKKMEKRAELLNGMRKENEALLMQIKESDELREQAEAARKESEARLQEVQRTQEMMQADFDQFAMEKNRVIADLEEETQRLLSEKEQADAMVQELTLRIQELEREKLQIEEECERIKEAEQVAFQARLNTATAAVQTAKQDLQKVHDALETSKAENEKRQRLIESLELKLKEQSKTVSTAETNSTPVPVPQLAGPTAGLEKELSALRSSEMTLRKQLDDAREELIGLQERFATTKAANAEKVFTLEEESNRWKMESAAATEEVCRLNTVLEARKSNGNVAAVTSSSTKGDQTTRVSGEQSQELSDDVQRLKTELQDANTEISLLSRALDACREELQAARDQIEILAPSSEPESGEDSSGVSKTSAMLLAKDEALKKLRVQVLELQEELQALREEKKALELEAEKEELDELQATRKHIQSEKERAMQLQRRQTLVSSFEKQVASIVEELQKRLEEHSSAFRDVCDFRDEHRTTLLSDGAESALGKTNEPEFEECLVMRSGVVIKAGASFQLPVICEKSGWRVVWNFSVKEEAADVSFKLSAMTDTSTEAEVVSPERMNEMSGVFQVRQDNTTLVFEWDNSFSWLNEKTLDYHVSIQEPLTPEAKKVRRSERELQTKVKLLEEGLSLIQIEAQRRSELSATLQRLSEWEATKEKHLTEFGARKAEVLEKKTKFQEEMDVQKVAFSAMLREQDELEDVERSITRAWEAAMAEREDVEMTLQLAGNGAQLETLAHELEDQVKVVTEQLKNPKPVEDIVEDEEEKVNNEVSIQQGEALDN